MTEAESMDEPGKVEEVVRRYYAEAAEVAVGDGVHAAVVRATKPQR